MSAATLSADALTRAQARFFEALPSMDKVFRYRFRTWPRRRRAEAITDARAAAWHAWIGLVRRGRDPLFVGPTGIAANACRYVRNGRRLGCGTVRRGALDVYDPRAQRRLGVTLLSLDPHAGTAGRAGADPWREWLSDDRRVTPADEAAFRIDFAAWLDRLPARKRRMAELLAQGHETGVVARMLGVTPGAVCQSRAWLNLHWEAFQTPCATGA